MGWRKFYNFGKMTGILRCSCTAGVTKLQPTKICKVCKVVYYHCGYCNHDTCVDHTKRNIAPQIKNKRKF
jgi:hypothetical protein